MGQNGFTVFDKILVRLGFDVGDKDNGNYIEFEEDGTDVRKGDATMWDDLVGSLVGRRLESVVGALQYNYDNNSITMNSGGDIDASEDRIIFSFQYPHAAIADGEMRLHIHWEQVDSTAREFTVQYRIQKNNSRIIDNQ